MIKEKYVMNIRNLKQVRTGYFLSEKLHKLHNDLPFLLERMKTEKVEKLVVNWHDKKEYITHIRNLDKALNH